MSNIVFMFFFKKFLEGFVWGCFIRLFIAMMVKEDFSLRGLLMSGLVGGIILTAIKYYVVANIF